MTDYAKLGWLDKIVDVNWGTPVYVLLQFFISATSDPSAAVTFQTAPGVKQVYYRSGNIDHGAPASSFPVAYLQSSSQPFATDPQSFHVNCFGFYNYFGGTGFEDVGYPDADTAWANSAVDNGLIGAWYNNGSTPSSAKSAWNAMPADLATDPAFAGIPVGTFANSGVAAAFASAVASHQASGGWANAPPDVAPDPFNPICQVIVGEHFAPNWFPNIASGTVIIPATHNVVKEVVVMFEVSASALFKKAVDVTFSGAPGGDWNTFAYLFTKKDHKLDPSNADRNPLGSPNGHVYFPLSPSSGETDTGDLDGGGHKQVWVKKDALTIR